MRPICAMCALGLLLSACPADDLGEVDGQDVDDGELVPGNDDACELGPGPELVVAVNYASDEATANGLFMFSDLTCVAGQTPSLLSCLTAPDVTEEFGVVAGVVGEAPVVPWASGDSVRLSTNRVLDAEFNVDDTEVVVRSSDGALLLLASAGISAPGDLGVPLQISTDVACTLDTEETLLRVTYELEDTSAELIGFGAATLEAASGTYAIQQQADFVVPGNGGGDYLKLVVVRTGD